MRAIRISRNAMLVLLLIFFMTLGSVGTVALANYTNVLVEASVVNVRLGPGLSYDIMTQVQGGSSVNVLSERNEWYKVRLDDGRIGWIASWLIDNTEVAASQNLMATVAASSVNVREENNSDSEIIGTASSGEQFNLLYEENGWSQIAFNNRVGWILSELVDITPGTIEIEEIVTETPSETTDSTVTITSERVNLRIGPSLNDDVVYTASQGESFTFSRSVGDFYEIILTDGSQAYVANWLVDLSGESSQAEAPVITTTLSEATIVIDPGHGGSDPGALGSYVYEKDVTMSTAEQLAEKLEAVGANVILTRTTDASVSLDERVWISNSYRADLFISLHYDSTPEGMSASGFTTYYYDNTDSYLADLVNSKLAQNLPLPNNGVAFGDYLVLRENTQPALLLELGYMNNDSDAAVFDNNYYRDLVSTSILQALTEYFQ
ncbi:N-acetylmuramoyl-L-alanine amidase [Jeotgalibaca sp. PTS2502]|uniref:N-acetylmuramoyl-L-alanine amidase n=1 Tax=Jeotgalibaca sp. PTS2502 TaxID=1903686 RepID=UPI001E3315DA|nr:N-acetylmuramoyl-L-alanine amidase [Jeotgalibaca sp. PTS2502]